MATTVRELRSWLAQSDGDELVGVDEGGLTLIVVDDPSKGLAIQPYFEVGGFLEDDEDAEVHP